MPGARGEKGKLKERACIRLENGYGGWLSVDEFPVSQEESEVGGRIPVYGNQSVVDEDLIKSFSALDSQYFSRNSLI